MKMKGKTVRRNPAHAGIFFVESVTQKRMLNFKKNAFMLYKRMPIEKESPEEVGYDAIDYNLSESSVTDIRFEELNVSLEALKLEYIGHRGHTAFRKMIAAEAGLDDENNVLLTAGAAGALFIINTSLLTEKTI